MIQHDVILKVSESFQQDVGFGRARIDHQTRMELDLSVGDIIEIEGQKKTAASVWRAHPSDEGKKIIRIDNLTRKNAGTGLGESVKIHRSDPNNANEIILAPLMPKGQQVEFGMGIDVIIKKNLLRRPLVKGDEIIIPGIAFFGNALPFMIVDTKPGGVVVINERTVLKVKEEAETDVESEGARVSYEDIGGLREEIQKVREMIELPLKHPELFDRLGIDPPKGVLLYGPPGTGKTLIAKAVANESGANFFTINGPEIMSKFYGQSEENLRKVFEDAQKSSPSIIFLDEIDAIAPKRSEVHGEVERRVVSQMLTLMDGLQSRGKVIVIGATNIPDSLDPALRRPGRFDREIRIDVPDADGRKEILQIHTRGMPIASSIWDLEGSNINVDKLMGTLKNNIKRVNVSDLLHNVSELEMEAREDSIRDYLDVCLKTIESETTATFYERLLNVLTDEIDGLLPEDMKQDIDLKVEPQIQDKIDGIFEKPKDFLKKMAKESLLNEISDITYGFVGADLAALAREAAMNALRRYLPEIDLEKPIPVELLEKMEVTMDDFIAAHRGIEPSAIREFFIEVPKISWDDVGGLELVKQQLRESVEWPLSRPDIFQRMGIEAPRGILLYGPPGTGKTLLAKAVAHESKANFISIKGPEIMSKWVGESEKAVRELFKKARQVAPTIVFLDEIDSIAPQRGATSGSHVTESVVNQLLTSIDGLESMQGVVIIGATNRPDIIDRGLLRPGRFDRLILTKAPDYDSRLEIFKIHSKGMPLASDVSLENLAQMCSDFSGADIEGLCREAAIIALREDMNASEIGRIHFEKAMDVVRGSITDDTIKFYETVKDSIAKSVAAKKDKKERDILYT